MTGSLANAMAMSPTVAIMPIIPSTMVDNGMSIPRLCRQRSMRAVFDHSWGLLNEREQEVFQLVAGGMANKAIAAQLEISERTVEVHRSQVMKKLDARTLAQLVRIHLQAE